MLYLNDTYQFTYSGKILSCSEDERGSYFLLDQTIFYPQGGGQPCDQGFLSLNQTQIPIHFVRQLGDEIRHYSKDMNEEMVGQSFLSQIDSERRLLNARYHTAGQLLGNFIEEKFPESSILKAHHWPDEACLEFSALSGDDIAMLESDLNSLILQDRSVTIFPVSHEDFVKVFSKESEQYESKKELRAVQIEGFKPVPCGGTHLKSLKEIGVLKIKKIITKKYVTRISYTVHDV